MWRVSSGEGDETEILIRILSFGPVLKVIEPEDMVARIRERLAQQRDLLAAPERKRDRSDVGM